MMHRFPNRAAALRSLKDISTDAVKNAKNLITEEDGMFCFDEDTAEQYLDSNIDNTENIMTTLNIKTATTAQLVDFYNDHAESSIKKFRDRATAEARCQALLEALAAEPTETVEVKRDPMIGNMTLSQVEEFAKAHSGKKAAPETSVEAKKFIVIEECRHTPETSVEETLAVEMKEDGASVYGYADHGFINCPSCGVHLCNGVGTHMDEVNGKYIKHDEFEFACLGCGAEFGPAIPGKKAKSESDRAHSETQAVTMKTSLKLDRTIVWLNTGEEYKNAFQMWKANPAIMTSSQQDTLTAKLYAAAKEGVKLVVTVNGNDFQLKNV